MQVLPRSEHLDWPNPEAMQARLDVQALLDSPGWAVLKRSIEDRLRFEQRMEMNDATVGQGEAHYERTIGRWEGMRRLESLALGIVRYGEKAETETRAAEAAGGSNV